MNPDAYVPDWLKETFGRARRFNEGLAELLAEAPCPHCPCTYSTECCYCDGTRTPLEDS